MKRTTTVIFLLLLLALLNVMLVACAVGGTEISLYDGDSFYKQITISAGESYDFGVPQKNGYTFLGWYSEKEGGVAYTNAMGKSDGATWKASNSTKVYAHFKANNYLIVFDYCEATGGNTIESMAVTYDAELGTLPVPEKEGLAFEGWYTDKEKGKQITDMNGVPVAGAETFTDKSFTLSSEGTVLYARFGAKRITYTFVSEGSEVKSVTHTAGTVLYELPTSIKADHCFVSWCFDEDLMEPLEFPYSVLSSSEENVTLYAKFEAGSNDRLRFDTINSDREYKVSYEGTDERLVVPSSYFGKKVTRVGKFTSTTVREILLPQTVTVLDNGAFEGCTALERINNPCGVDALPQNLFKDCAALESIIIPQKVKTIGKEAFAGCAAIASLMIPAGVETINAGAFRDMKALAAFSVASGNEKYKVNEGVLYCKIGTSNVHLVQYPLAKEGATYTLDPDTVKILDYAFSGSSIGSIVLGGALTKIEKGAFENCQSLISVTISSTTKATLGIGANAFASCSNLKALKLELSAVPSLDATALSGYSESFTVYVNSAKIKDYQLKDGWRTISSRISSIGNIFGDFAVEEVEGGYAIKQYFGTATEVVIGEAISARAIVKIGENAFSFTAVERVVIPRYVTEIGQGAFSNCTSLRTIVMQGEQPPVLGVGAFEGIDPSYGIEIDSTLEVLNAYKAAPGWIDIASKIWSVR